MKKLIILSIAAMLSPCLSMAQSTNPMSGEWFGLLIALIIVVIVFLILRQVMLWYGKVEVIIKNQEEQNNRLKSIYDLLDEIARYNIELVEKLKQKL